MEFLKRILFVIAAACFLAIVVTFVFSLFLIVWPFLAVGVLASIGYAWLSNYKRTVNGETGEGAYYHWERIIILEHDDQQDPQDKTKKD